MGLGYSRQPRKRRGSYPTSVFDLAVEGTPCGRDVYQRLSRIRQAVLRLKESQGMIPRTVLENVMQVARETQDAVVAGRKCFGDRATHDLQYLVGHYEDAAVEYALQTLKAR
jgi:hypothetical protein